MLVDLGSVERVREVVDERLHDLIDDLTPDDRTVSTLLSSGAGIGQDVGASSLNVRLRDDSGRVVGTMCTYKPTASMTSLAQMAINSDAGHLDRVPEVARRSDLDPDDIVVRMGLHWGSTLYVGNITSVGRSEVTAMGDAVNEAARIEACAAGGRTLASKELVERLDDADAGRLDIDPMRVEYTPLADLPSASEKARRDAPAIAVCDLRPSG